ncbi:hypothetical protein MSKU15_0960 [Komagataeibacter diospyri]|nr:hypothetical protein MSKU15_0960 [Komagataeibacter diospyri]
MALAYGSLHLERPEMNINAQPERQQAFPARYYAQYDPATRRVTGWHDTWALSSVAHVPPASGMHPVTPEDWTSLPRHLSHRIGEDGVIVRHVHVIPLPMHARRALADARRHVWNEYGALGETVPAEWIAYQKALLAIRDGADATSAVLPPPPAAT